MARVPEPSQAPAPVLPWLPLPAILGFTLLGVGGSVLLTVSTFNFAEPSPSPTASRTDHIYDARAVPFDSIAETPARRMESISRALTAAQSEVRRAEVAEPEQPSDVSGPVLLDDSDPQLRGFNAFGNFAGGNTYLAITGTSFGISAQNAPGFAAPDAETLSMAPVPEVATWMYGGALFLLVAARGARAHWYRKRRRDS